MYSLTATWQLSPFYTIVGMIGFAMLTTAILRRSANAGLYITGSFFLFPYFFSNIFYIFLGTTFFSLLSSQIITTISFFITFLFARRNFNVPAVELVKHSLVKTILIVIACATAALAAGVLGANFDGYCTGQRCSFYQTVLGDNISYVKIYGITTLGSMLYSFAISLTYAKIIEIFESERRPGGNHGR